LKVRYRTILDVRTSAHLWYFRTSFGGLVPISTRPGLETHQKSSVCLCSGIKRYRKPNKQWSWHRSSGNLVRYSLATTWARHPTDADMQTFVHRMNQTRPHISSDIIHVKQRGPKTKETKSTQIASLTWRILRQLPQNSVTFQPKSPASLPAIRPVQRPVSASAPPVKGVLRITTITRNPKNRRNGKKSLGAKSNRFISMR